MERACPTCSAPAQDAQRWCLECGAELPAPRRRGLRPAVGVATTLAVLVGAASAGGYTLLQHQRQPPPAATTVAQAAPATTTPPPATQEPATSSYTPPSTYYTPPKYYSGATTYQRATTTPAITTPSGTDSGGAGYNGGTGTGAQNGGGSGTGGGQQGGGTPPPPRKVLTNVALGAPAVVYAPYTASDVDLGDATRVADESTRTAWKTPPAADPTASPQIGVYIDLGSPDRLRTLVLQTPTPGMSVEIYGATKGPPPQITDPGWDHIATRRDLAAKTTVRLHDKRYRYVLVWVVGLPPGATRAAISELALTSLQPE